MKMKNIAAMLTLAATAGLYAGDSMAQRSCADGPMQHKVRIRVVQDRPVEVLLKGMNADDLHVCLGDTVEFKLQGSEKKFYLRFADGSPFSSGDNPQSSNGKIEMTVDTGSPGDAFKYDIGIEGGEVWDPRIVIDD